MNLTTHTETMHEIVKMPASLTSQNANTIAKGIAELLENGGTSLVLDMSEMKFADSTGLAALVSTYKNVTSRNGHILLQDVQPDIKLLLEMTRLDSLFTIN